MPLTLSKSGEVHAIKKIGGNSKVREHLEALGFLEGEEVIVLTQLNGNVIVSLKGTRVAISEELANKIII